MRGRDARTIQVDLPASGLEALDAYRQRMLELIGVELSEGQVAAMLIHFGKEVHLDRALQDQESQAKLAIPAELERKAEPEIRTRAKRELEPAPAPKTASARKEKSAPERKVRTILCACRCGETFEWEVKTGRAPQYIPGHQPSKKQAQPIPQTPKEAVTDRPAPRWNCPKHGAVCRTPNLCKTTYTRSN